MSTTRRTMLVSAATVAGAVLGAAGPPRPAQAAAEVPTPVYPSTETVPLGAVSGSVVLDLARGGTFTCTVAGDTVFTFVNWPSGVVSTEPTVIATQDGVGHTISYTGITWLPGGTVPRFETGANQVNINCFVSDDNGTTVYGQGGGATGGGFGVYGDGSDGAVLLDGSRSYPFLGRSGTFYWLLRDIYASSLVIAPGIALQLAGGDTAPFRVFCSGVVSVASTAYLVTYPNKNASGATGGTNLATGSLAPGASAPNGGTGVGGAGTGVLGQSGLAAGKGGTAKSGATAGGAGGVSSLPAGYSLPRALPWAATMAAYGPNVSGTTKFFPGGASGGAGAGDGSASGGGGGAGGNPLFVAAYHLVNNGTIVANGGKGGNTTGGNGGGGGGGQGGPIMLIYGGYSGNGGIVSAGGAGGSGAGTGSAGTTGGPSWIIRLVN